MSYHSRHTAVIGGSTGIGLALAQQLLANDGRVTIGGRDEGRLADARSALGDQARAVSVDATDCDSLRRFYEAVGPISDLVITATRRGGAGPAAALADTQLLDGFEGKSVAQLQAVSLALETLAADGSITLLSAGSAQASLPDTAGLAAVNGALEAAVPVLARELAPRRINAVSPGVIETDWWDFLDEADRKSTFALFAKRAPVGRNGTAEDVAQAIVACMENTFMTGAVLPCDGGLRLT